MSLDQVSPVQGLEANWHFVECRIYIGCTIDASSDIPVPLGWVQRSRKNDRKYPSGAVNDPLANQALEVQTPSNREVCK